MPNVAPTPTQFFNRHIENVIQEQGPSRSFQLPADVNTDNTTFEYLGLKLGKSFAPPKQYRTRRKRVKINNTDQTPVVQLPVGQALGTLPFRSNANGGISPNAPEQYRAPEPRQSASEVQGSKNEAERKQEKHLAMAKRIEQEILDEEEAEREAEEMNAAPMLSETDDELKRKKAEALKENQSQSTIPFPLLSKVEIKCPPPKPEKSIWSSDETNPSKVDKALIRMIAKDILPLRTVEKEGFQFFMKLVAPKYKIHSRQFYTKTCLPQLRREIEQKIKSELKGMASISLTCDGWTSQNGKHSLLSVTGHFLDKESFKPKVIILGARAVKGRHTAVNLSDSMASTLKDFDIDLEKVECCTRDGAPNVIAMCNQLSIKSLHCYAHVIQLCVKDVLAEIAGCQPLIEKMKKIVRKVNKCGHLREVFSDILNDEGMLERCLVQQTEVRWSSLYKMIAAFLQNRRALTVLILDHEDLGFPFISNDEWETLNLLETVFKPLAETTTSLQSRFGAPASVVIPSVELLEIRLDEMKVELSDKHAIIPLLDKLIESIGTRCAIYKKNDFLKTASFLDPRFRDTYFDQSHKKYVAKLMRKISGVKEMVVDAPIENDSEKPSIFERYKKKKQRTPEPEAPTDAIDDELEIYLKGAALETIDPYDFWRGHDDLPMLKALALKYLTTPATSSESERLFSVSGVICTPKRSRLSAENVDNLTFCSLNLGIIGLDFD
ncbi:hypothetical protein CAEBREN_11563 [Caenorhabditis brenneri]|uniref:HAT C-terminal dimerisation domain-containing protein n=1 Tax=Caenorhabditis brenneri TaxID=135651 RepID=G0NB81_CAEBE|nr:hypothetical protein CAEBREN_11563 [Caenorhabditis brenneri]